MGIDALLFHALLLVPQQDRREKWSQGTTKLLCSPESWMDREAQPHTEVLSCITCRSQGFSFPQTHLEGNTRALPASLLTHVSPPTQSTVLERDGVLLSSLGLHSLAVLPISSERSQQAGSSSGALP